MIHQAFHEREKKLKRHNIGTQPFLYISLTKTISLGNCESNRMENNSPTEKEEANVGYYTTKGNKLILFINMDNSHIEKWEKLFDNKMCSIIW